MSTDDVEDEPRTLLGLLGDEYVQSILVATGEEAKSAAELARELDVARSTVYRRAEAMLAHDLLVERTRIVGDGSHHSVYAANVDHLDIDLDGSEFRVDVRTRESPSDRFTRLWTGIREA